MQTQKDSFDNEVHKATSIQKIKRTEDIGDATNLKHRQITHEED